MDFSEFHRNIGSARKETWRMKLDPQAVEICSDFQYIRSSGSHFNYCYCLSATTSLYFRGLGRSENFKLEERVFIKRRHYRNWEIELVACKIPNNCEW